MSEPGLTFNDAARSLAPTTTPTATGSWLGSKKRDWENAFQAKHSDLEATLQENDRWLALYWESIEGMKGAKPDIAITKALKTSSARRRGRARMDVRNVFDAPNGESKEYLPQDITRVSPFKSPFNTASLRSYRVARTSSQNSVSLQGNTLTWALSQLPMIPPAAPGLTGTISTVTSSLVGAEDTQDTAVEETGEERRTPTVGIIRSPRAIDSTAMKKPPNYPQASLTRSNSAAARAAAAVKHLQAMAVTPPKKDEEEIEASPQEQKPETTPVPGQPDSKRSESTSPKKPGAGGRFTPVTPVPTLRDLLLNRHSTTAAAGPASPTNPMAPTTQPGRPYASINKALGSLSLEASSQQAAAAAELSQSSSASSPESLHPHMQARSLSMTSSDAEHELTKSEEDVRERLQRVRIALGSSAHGMTRISEHTEMSGESEAEESAQSASVAHAEAVHIQAEASERIGHIAEALSPNSTEADLTALRRDIAAIESMLPSSLDTSLTDENDDANNQQSDQSASSADEDKQDVSDGQQSDVEGREEQLQAAKPEDGGIFVDVVIDQQPMDVRLEDVKVDEAVKPVLKHKAGLPGKRKHSNDDLNARANNETTAQSRLMAPTASSMAKGRGRGKARAAGLSSSNIPRKPILRSQASVSSISSQQSSASNPRSGATTPAPAHGAARPGSRLDQTSSRIAVPAGPGHVAATRKKFEPVFGSKDSAAVPFASPVATMRPGYASMRTPVASASSAHTAGSHRQQQQQQQTGTAGKSRGANAPPTTLSKLHQKSSTAAMREAARRAEAGKRPVQHRAGNEPLFKSVSRPASALSNKSSQASLRSKPSREQVRAARNPSGLIPEVEILKTPPSQRAAAAVKRTRQSDESERVLPPPHSALPSAIPIPATKGKSAAAGSGNDSAESSKPGSVESGWGISSVLSMLSPSSWKAQQQVQQPEASAANAGTKRPAVPETPTVQPSTGNITSPYDVNSPQTPYQPQPEHGGSLAQLVMPKYQDMAVPLRRSSSFSRASTSSSVSQHQGAVLQPVRKEPSFQQRLISQATDGRISGVSSFRSSFFSDDEYASANSSSAAHNGKRSLGLGRTKSTPDMAQDQSMVTPAQGLRHRKVSAMQHEEYTSIIPKGSNSPPEIESDYSDEYSDEEFSPAPKRKKNDFKIPKWATTPELAKGLKQQERVNPDRIFGRVKPLRINEIFNRKETEEMRRKPRNSSMIWSGRDALTSEDELEYIRRMGFDQ